MLSSVLRSERAALVNIEIMRAFIELRKHASARAELAGKLKELEIQVKKHEADINEVFEAVRELLDPESDPRPIIGFRP